MWRILVMVSILLVGAHSARILAFMPFPAHSHHFAFRTVFEELGRRGHEIVYVTSVPYKANITQIRIDDTVPDIGVYTDPIEFGEMSLWENLYFSFTKTATLTAHGALSYRKVQELIHSTDVKFDVVMIEPNVFQEY